MASAQYLEMLQDRILNVTSDTRPWGGISPIFDLDVRVESINRNVGAAFDTVQMIFPNNNFGVEQTYFLPVRITDDSTSKVLYRGFVTVNEGNMNPSTEFMSVSCVCYKWLLSKRSMIRGKWYLNKGEISAPAGGMGSGISAGDQKFTYERFRSDLQEGSGFLQNEQTVFNQGGVPDCFQDNLTSGTTLAYYMDTVDIDETEGLPDTYFERKTYSGHYWTWVTIIRYIHTYFIEPYNVALAPVDLNSTDLTALAGIVQDLRQPINFSIEGYNPMTALDYVVAQIPGRWYWYMEYTSTTSTIRIRELDDTVPNNVVLEVCPIPNPPGTPAEKLVNSNANLSSLKVRRDANAAVANVVGIGGKVKLVTTVKLVPTWTRYNGGTSDFIDEDDYNKWILWATHEFDLEKTGLTEDHITLTGQEETRYPLIYRVYAIPMEGELFGDRIVSVDPDASIDIFDLDGDVGTHYTAFTKPGGGGGADFRDYFFQNAKIQREVSPPEFERFNDKVQVFMYDSRYDSQVLTDSSDNTVNKKKKVSKTANSPTAAQKTASTNRNHWVIPERDKISYNFDQKNMMVVFDQPQPKQKNSLTLSNKEKFAKTIKESSFDGATKTIIETRDVYMTATYTTDLAAIFGSIISGGFVETINGAPFSAYVKARNQDIVYHFNAFYPITNLDKDILSPIDSTDLMDGHILGDVIRRCDSFDNYRKYIGQGHYELGRAILNWKEGYLNYREDITADLPYMEIDNDIGDGLTTIVNSGYIGIASYLIGISWKRSGDSDSMLTTLTFNNYYSTDRNNLDFAPLRLDENKKRFNRRTKFNFTDEVPSGDMPPI